MAKRLFLRSNVQTVDSLLFSGRVSMFTPRPPTTVTDFVKEEVEWVFSNAAWGNTVMTKSQQVADILGPEELNYEVSPLVSTLPAQAGSAFVDGAGIWGCRVWNQTYAGNQIQRLTPDWNFIKYQRWTDDEDKFSLEDMIPINLSFAQRQARALSNQHWIVPMNRNMGSDTNNMEPLVCLSQDILYEVQLPPLASMVNTPDGLVIDENNLLAGATGAIQRLFLRSHLRHLTGAERDSLVTKTQSDDGIAYLVEDIQVQNVDFVGPTDSVKEFDIKNINSACTEIYFLIRPAETYQKDAATSGNADPFFTPPKFSPGAAGWTSPFTGNQYFLPTHISIRSNGIELVKRQPVKEYLDTMVLKYHSGRGVGGVISYSFSQQPELNNANLGSINFGSLNNPSLVLEWADPARGITQPCTAGTMCVTMIGDVHNFSLIQGGDYQRVFH